MENINETQPVLIAPLSEIVEEDTDITNNDTSSTMPGNKPFIGFIYKIVFPNGKHYIGLTTSLERRTKEHKKLAKTGDLRILYKAIRKYDMIDTFELIEIDTATTFEELCKKEIEYIQTYKSHYMSEFGYNMTLGGEGIHGCVYTAKTRQKMSESRKQYFIDHPEAGVKNSEAQKKYYIENPEARVKNSEAQKKYNREHPEAVKEKGKRKTKYNKDHPEVLEKQSERMKQWCKENPDVLERYRILGNKRWESQEKRQQMSEKKKQYYKENPDAIRNKLDKYGKNKPFDVFTTDGTFIDTFTYQYEAREYLQQKYNISSYMGIGSVLSGKKKQSLGFVFKYKTI